MKFSNGGVSCLSCNSEEKNEESKTEKGTSGGGVVEQQRGISSNNDEETEADSCPTSFVQNNLPLILCVKNCLIKHKISVTQICVKVRLCNRLKQKKNITKGCSIIFLGLSFVQ